MPAEPEYLTEATLVGSERDQVEAFLEDNRAVAMSQIGPHEIAPSLDAVDELADRLDGYHLFHATRAQLLTRLGRDDEAAAANARALALTTNEAERRLLATRLHRHPLTDGS